MKRVAVISVALVALIVTGGAAYVQAIVPGTSGCTLTSVDERAYVAGNEAVFRTITLPRGLTERYSTTWTHAVPATDKCVPLENGPPYDAFVTTRVYVGSHLGFDERILRRDGWMPQAFTLSMSSFRRGTASIAVTRTGESVLLAVDHRAYADSGG